MALAWLDAVEAPLAPAVRTIVRRRLARAQTRRVTFAAGSVLAEIRQPSYRSHIATIRVPIAGEAVWEALLGAAAHHARWLASLAVGDLGDEDLAAALVDAGLVPPGLELSAQCTCRSEVRLCVHAALAAHVAARVLTAEPARMLVVRGITLDRIRGRIADRLPGPAGTDTVDPAAIDWDALVTADVAPFPPPPRPPLAPGRAVPAPEPPPSAGFGADDVVALAEDAAARALEVLVDGGEGALDLDVDADLARRVAQLPPGGVLALAD
ncbi:MAG TPA: hypothetical protein VFO60_08700, partial [Candidatus Dormibacteraeota bacterium]|nr:hypothetical protein [Candidatus Dormibacteraeota bacterium]